MLGQEFLKDTMKRDLVFALLFCLYMSMADSQQPVVVTSIGSITGRAATFHDATVNVFKGIPYAQPPVGNLRFQKPQPVQSWDGSLDATQYRSQCLQPPPFVPLPWLSDTPMSEDCLYLNIWSPASCTTEKNPVMMWIHGGAWMSGSGNGLKYDGTAWAALGCVVVVTINYRLTVFGFLNFDTDKIPGNQAFWDHNMALTWVRDHISNFGGDPDAITLCGASAGAMSIGAHLLSSKSNQMFHRAIIHSGGPTNNFLLNPADVIRHSVTFAQRAGCLPPDNNNPDEASKGDAARCLQQLSTQEIFDLNNQYLQNITFQAFYATTGGEFWSGNVGMRQGVSVILGNVFDEGPVVLVFADPRFIPLFYDNATVSVEEARDLWSSRLNFRTNTDETDAMDYSFEGVTNGDRSAIMKALNDLAGQSAFVCPTQMMAEHASSVGNNVYYFVYNHLSSNYQWPPWFGVALFSDVPFSFGHPLLNAASYTPEEVEFSRDLVMAWSSFAKSGTPTFPSGVSWPLYSKDSPKYMMLKPKEYTSLEGYEPDACRVWRPHLSLSNIK